MIAVLALLAIQGRGFDTLITMESKDTMLPIVLKRISEKAGIEAITGRDAPRYKVTVFVKDMKARDLLDRIASVLSLDTAIAGNQYKMSIEQQARVRLTDYVNAETALRMRMIGAKLWALAKLTNRPFVAATGEAPPLKPDETPDEWAARKISQPAYYAAGLCVRESFAIFPNHASGPWAEFCQEPHAFCVTAPTWTYNPPSSFVPCYIDENSRSLEGTLIAICCYETTAELKIIPIGGEPATETTSDRPYIFSRPPNELAKTEFAKRLAAWETPIEKVPREALAKSYHETDPPPDPGYYNGRISLSEKLESIYKSTGTPIIATSYRTPTIGPPLPVDGTLADLVANLADKEKAILRWDQECLLLRHPSYWLFDCSEVPEEVLLRAEAIAKTRPLTLPEYGDIARVMSAHPDDLPLSNGPVAGTVYDLGYSTGAQIAYNRLPMSRGLLLRFDPEPLERAYPALFVIGTMSKEEQGRFFAGEHLDSWKVVGTINGSKAGFDGRADIATDFAPLFGATQSPRYFTPSERTGFRHNHVAMLDQTRARYIWLDSSGDGAYQINLGFTDVTTATYSFTIHPNPK